MFYEPKGKGSHGLPHDPFRSIVVPRPIGWISTVSGDGVVNLAPYSFFNGVSYAPPMVMFAPNGQHAEGGHKDTLSNIVETGEFVVNVATWELREEMNASSAAVPRAVDEMAMAGLEAAPSRLVRPPRVKASPVHLECVHVKTVELPADDPESPNNVVFGRVVGIHISDDILTDGLVDMSKFRPIGRLGYFDYTVVDNVFTMPRPNVEEVMAAPAAARAAGLGS
jgi:flavin reductase (DIM6/NTAB) family NADH-FMN oxidoreductase RutF